MILKCAGTGSSGNSYALISDSGQILLIECGVNWKKTMRMIDYQISNVVGCIASHAHQDHLKEYKKVLENWIPIYTNDETVEGFQIVTGELLKGVPEKKWFQCREFKVMGFYVPHDGCPNYAYIIYHSESGYILYATDMMMISKIDDNYMVRRENGQPVLWSFKNLRLNHMVIEVNYDLKDLPDKGEKESHVGYGHHSLQACKRFIEDNKTLDLRTVTLIHLSDETDKNRVLKEIKEVAGDRVEVNVAVPGLEVELKKFPF